MLGIPVLACPISAGHHSSFKSPWFTACPMKFAFFFCSHQWLSCSSSKLVAVEEKLYWSKVNRQGRLYLRLLGQGCESELHSTESKDANIFKYWSELGCYQRRLVNVIRASMFEDYCLLKLNSHFPTETRRWGHYFDCISKQWLRNCCERPSWVWHWPGGWGLGGDLHLKGAQKKFTMKANNEFIL